MTLLTTKDDGRGVYLKDPPAGYWEKEAQKGLYPYLAALLPSRIPASGKVLDIGCEAGRTSLPLAKLGYQVWGVDIFKKALLFAARHAKNPANHWIQAQAQSLPFRDGSFDAALLIRQFLSLFHDRTVRLRILKECHRVLKDQGVIMLSIQNGALNPTIWHFVHYLYCRIFLYPFPKFSAEKMREFGLRLKQLLSHKIQFICNQEIRLSHDLLISTSISEQIHHDVRFHQYDWKEIRRDLDDSGFEIVECRDFLEFEKNQEIPALLRKGAPYLAIIARKVEARVSGPEF